MDSACVFEIFCLFVDTDKTSKMDVINLLSKHTDFPDAPVTNPNEEWQYAPMYFANGYVWLVNLVEFSHTSS